MPLSAGKICLKCTAYIGEMLERVLRTAMSQGRAIRPPKPYETSNLRRRQRARIRMAISSLLQRYAMHLIHFCPSHSRRIVVAK